MNLEEWYKKGVSLDKLGKYEQAIGAYEKCLEINPEHADIWILKGIALNNLDKYEEAIKACDEAIQINPEHVGAWFLKGSALDDLEKYEEAIKACDEAIQINPEHVDAWILKGLALNNIEKYEEAIKACDKALEMNPEHADAWFCKGLALNDLEKYKEAIKAFDKAIQINPEHVDAWIRKGLALTDFEKYVDAIEAYEKALEINPVDADAWLFKGSALSDIEKYEEAIKAYDEAIQINPDHYYAWLGKFVCLADLGRDTEARASYDKALEVKQKYAEVCTSETNENEQFIHGTADSFAKKIISHKNFPLCLNIFESLLGLVLFLFFINVNSIGLKTLFLFFGVVITFWAIFEWLNILFASLPTGHYRRLAVSFGILSIGIYNVIYNQSLIWAALAWILTIIGILSVIVQIQRTLFEFGMLRMLLRAYKHKQTSLPDLGIPFVYIQAEPGMGVHLAQRLVGNIMKSLYKHQYLSPKSELTVFTGFRHSMSGRYMWKRRNRAMVIFIVSDSVRRLPVEFRKWLVSCAAAFIVFRAPYDTDEPYSESFEEEANSGYDLCLGPTFTILVNPPMEVKSHPSYVRGDQVLEYSWDLHDLSLDSVIAPLSNRLASTALPIVASDSRLDIEKRRIIQEIATSGLTPVANSYLSFRLAHSDVERYESLINCIESLIRCSTIILIINRWNNLNKDENFKNIKWLMEGGNIPTLGTWVYALGDLTESPMSIEIDEEVCSFWKGGISQKQRLLINKVDETGLYSINHKEETQLGWIKWFTKLRNVTKGHGSVKETSIGPFWHILHEIFLEMVSQLQPFTISSYLVAIEPNGKEVVLRGWLRDKSKYNFNPKNSEHETRVFLKLPSNQLIPLFPLVIVKESTVFVFDHLDKKEIELLNFGSEERTSLRFPESSKINLFDIWNLKKPPSWQN